MSERIFTLYFEDEVNVVKATKVLRENQYIIKDIFTPYAVHGLDDAMNIKKSRLGIICFILGIFGAIAKLSFQIWTSASNWPVNVGGKPLNSFPAFIPVTFEVMVLFAGIGTVIVFLLTRKSVFNKKAKINFPLTTDNRFAIVLSQNDASFDINKVVGLVSKFNFVQTEEQIIKI